jgi:hypothetical protein
VGIGMVFSVTSKIVSSDEKTRDRDKLHQQFSSQAMSIKGAVIWEPTTTTLLH